MLDKSNMSMRLKCRCCFPIETGCFIFGVFSCIIWGLSIVALCFTLTSVTGSMRSFTDQLSEQAYDHVEVQQRAMELMMVYVCIMILYLIAITSFIFSVFLCYGVQKKRSGFVKAYLVYGITVTVLMMLGAMAYSWLMRDIVGGSLILMACGVYSLLLLMVQRTFELFRAEANRERAQLLDAKPCLKA